MTFSQGQLLCGQVFCTLGMFTFLKTVYNHKNSQATYFRIKTKDISIEVSQKLTIMNIFISVDFLCFCNLAKNLIFPNLGFFKAYFFLGGLKLWETDKLKTKFFHLVEK